MKIQLKQWNPCLLVGLRQTKANKSTAMGVFHSLRWWVARGDGVVAIQPFLWAARTLRHLSFRKRRFVGPRGVCRPSTLRSIPCRQHHEGRGKGEGDTEEPDCVFLGAAVRGGKKAHPEGAHHEGDPTGLAARQRLTLWKGDSKASPRGFPPGTNETQHL